MTAKLDFQKPLLIINFLYLIFYINTEEKNLLTPNYLNIIVQLLHYCTHLLSKNQWISSNLTIITSTPGLIKITAKKFKNNECLKEEEENTGSDGRLYRRMWSVFWFLLHPEHKSHTKTLPWWLTDNQIRLTCQSFPL